MNDKSRKLLPYERQLIDSIGITKEEYLDFVHQQNIYDDPKEGTILDVRNWEAVAIVLTIVGVLFQVASVLLMPKPEMPALGGRRAARREQRFAPRFGFDGAQELALYGDPVNLVYTNKQVNPDGGVRVSTSLIWSAVQSYGNSQLAQLLFVLGAGGIGEIDTKKNAFGQTALDDLIVQNQWTYFKADYTGQLQKAFLLPDPSGLPKPATDPTTEKIGASSNPYRIKINSNGDLTDGFSHSYSPTTSSSFGLYGAVPVNVRIFVTDDDKTFAADNGITMNNWGGALQNIAQGTSFHLVIKQAAIKGNVAIIEASEIREASTSVFDNAGMFKLGAAKLKVLKAGKGDIIDSDMIVNLQCVEAGKGSATSYAAKRIQDVVTGIPEEKPGEFLLVERVSKRLLAIDDRLVDEDGNEVLPDAAGEIARPADARDLVKFGTLKDLKKKKVGKGKNKKIDYTYVLLRKLTADEINTLSRYADLLDLRRGTIQDNYFFSKAITRIEEASYETVSPCNIVDFSIKAKVFKRVSGRTSPKDNGAKMRSSMFLIKYKKASDTAYKYLPGIFVVRRSGDIDNFIYLRFNSGTTGATNAAHWQFKFEPVVDVQAELATKPSLKTNGQLQYHYLENTGTPVSQSVPNSSISFEFIGKTRGPAPQGFPPLNKNPRRMNEWDLFTVRSNDQVQFSFENGPEFSLAVVTEQIVDSFSNYDKLYQNMSLIGLNMYSGKTVRDLRSFSVFVNKGRQGKALPTSGNGWGGPTYDYYGNASNDYLNTAPDIFLDTILDKNDGIGQYASLSSVNLEKLAKSKKFCQQNKLFMDGIIADRSSWRAFWAENAGYSLLELAKIGGQDTLVPAIPANESTGQIDPNIKITALFTPGNILEDSYKEEFIDHGANTQDLIVSAVYRRIEKEGAFAKNISVDVKLNDVVEANALRQTIDMSAFVTRREQAILVAKFLCLVKRHSQRSIEFKTFPTDSPVAPGAYIYVELAQNQWNTVYSGAIEPGGVLNTSSFKPVPNGSYSVLTYTPGGGTAGTQSINGVTVTDNTAPSLSGAAGSLFVLGQVIKSKRVYKVTEVSMDEEGEVTIRGIEHATNAQGQSRLALDMEAAGLFQIDGKVV